MLMVGVGVAFPVGMDLALHTTLVDSASVLGFAIIWCIPGLRYNKAAFKYMS